MLTPSSKTRYRRSSPRQPVNAPVELPGVSILRPLRGLDANLYDNLESSFKQSYSTFEILCSVATADDQAIPIVRNLMQKYPDVDAQLIIGQSAATTCN
jgi:ceramide glucosyltransferase